MDRICNGARGTDAPAEAFLSGTNRVSGSPFTEGGSPGDIRHVRFGGSHWVINAIRTLARY